MGYGDSSVVDRQGCEGHNAQLKVAVVGVQQHRLMHRCMGI